MGLWYYSLEEFLDTGRAKHLFHTYISVCRSSFGFFVCTSSPAALMLTSTDASKMKPVRIIQTKLMAVKINW